MATSTNPSADRYRWFVLFREAVRYRTGIWGVLFEVFPAQNLENL